MRLYRSLPLSLCAMALMAGAVHAQTPRVTELRTQVVGETTYFHVRFEPPADLDVPPIYAGPYKEWQRRQLAKLPQLVPQDAKTSAVNLRVPLTSLRPNVGFKQRPATSIDGLEFVGKLHDKKKPRLLLLYPAKEFGVDREKMDLESLLRPARWVEVPVRLEIKQARALKPASKTDDADNLERLWAEGQAARLAVLEALTPEFGFYGFACAATGRKYGVQDPILEAERVKEKDRVHKQLFEMTTGTAAITQSLGLDRVRRPDFRDIGERTIDINRVQGINIAEHPWRQMMGDKTPAPEPLAELVPHDNYYISFKKFSKFLDFGDFLDQWGTNATRLYEVNSRDYHLKERYERQLCLKSSWVGRTLGPLLIKSVAVTGSDPYIREGSDVTVLFQVRDRKAFLTGVQSFIDAARKEFGAELKENKEKHRGIEIESFVSPLREVSVYRAGFDDFVVYSNSPVGLKRVLSTRAGWIQSLWHSLDFRYMRTVFNRDDKEEDGFAFLSDAFIRQLVGPASKIRERRRLEALTTLSMLTHGAMFTSWETGRMPASQQALLDAAALKKEYLFCPEGKTMRWDAQRQTAVSEAYNTLHFATPLIELPIDKITPTEERDYREFREYYIQLWRQFFDPVGMRFSLNDKQVKMEVYILPLANVPQYNTLRQLAGGGTTNLDINKISRKSLFHFHMHVGHPWRGFLGIGAWALIRLDDGPTLARLAESWVHYDLYPQERNWEHTAAMLFRLPVTLGVDIGNRDALKRSLGTWPHNEPGCKVTALRYKNVPILRMDFSDESNLVASVNRYVGQGKAVTALTMFSAEVDDAFYLGLSEAAVHEFIDRAEAKKNGEKGKKSDEPPYKSMEEYHVMAEASHRQGRPLVVFVGVHRPELEKKLTDHLSIRVASFPGVEKEGIVVGVPNKRWLTRHDLPAKATAQAIRRVSARTGQEDMLLYKPEPPGKDEVPINFSFHLSPRAAVQARNALEFYLEWEVHKRAVPNNAFWYTLYRCNLIDGKTPDTAKAAAAMKFVGFVPVSPDGASYKYDSRTGEVVNARHGSLRSPKFTRTLAADSPVVRLLDQFPSLRADMRFREDGMHAVITIERKEKK
jgi:hypothetical protein